MNPIHHIKLLRFPRRNELARAIDLFLTNEQHLLQNMAHELTISSKLANYLQEEFLEYNVDSNYNRKWIKETGSFMQKRLHLGPSSSDTSIVFPDIIIHDRNNSERNLIVIEIKKKEKANVKRQEVKEVSETEKEFDIRKLKAYIKDLGYSFGLYLEFDNSGISDLKLYR